MRTEYFSPMLDLLIKGTADFLSEEELHKSASELQEMLTSFGIGARVTGVVYGPLVTRYEVKLNPGISIRDIKRRQDDILLQFGCHEIMINPVFEKGVVAIDVVDNPNKILRLGSALGTLDFQNCEARIPVIIGCEKSGRIRVEDMTELIHILIGGTTGVGKTMFIHSILIGLLYKSRPDDVQCMIINPSKLDMAIYEGIPHLMLPVVTEEQKAVKALDILLRSMNNRYQDFVECNVKNIAEYNARSEKRKYSRIVVIIDNISDISKNMRDQVNVKLEQLLRKAAGAGIHFIIASTVPVTDVVSGNAKANIPTRISFHLRTRAESKMILDMSGAEGLRGTGDMIFRKRGERSGVNIQGFFISEKEIQEVVDYVRRNNNRIETAACENIVNDTTERNTDD